MIYPNAHQGPRHDSRARVTHHLPCSHAHRLDREFAPTHVEQVLEAGPQQVDDQDVVQTLLAKVVYLRNTNWEGKKNIEKKS